MGGLFLVGKAPAAEDLAIWMSTIATNTPANNTCFCFKSRYTRLPAINRQANKDPNGQADMVAL